MTPYSPRSSIASSSSRSTSAHRLRLPTKILTDVMKHAGSGDDSRKSWGTRNASLATFALVSHEWSGCATSLLYGDLRLEWRCEPATLLLRTVRQNLGILAFVQSVRVFLVQKLDVLEENLEDIRLQAPRGLRVDSPWQADSTAPVDRDGGKRRVSIEEEMYWIAEDRVWKSTDAPWLMEHDGIDAATSTFYDEFLSALPNLKNLELDQFLEPLPLVPLPKLVEALGRLRSFRANDTSSRLHDVVIPHLGRVEVLEADFRAPDDEEENMDKTDAIIPSRPFTASFPFLHTLLSGGALSTSLLSILASPSITTLHIGIDSVYDLRKLPHVPVFPSVLHLHLTAGRRQLCDLSVLAISFLSLTSLDLSNRKSAALRLEDLPSTLSSLRLSFSKWDAVRVVELVRFIREVLDAAGKGPAARLRKLAVRDAGRVLVGTQRDWDELVEVVGEAWGKGVWVDVVNY